MRRRDVSLTIAICVSLCVHAWAIHALLRGEYGVGLLQGGRLSKTAPQPRQRPIAVELIHLPKPEPIPRESEEEFGQSDGRGRAINSMQGEKLLRAKLSPEEQASLTRQPGQRRTDQVAKMAAARAVVRAGNARAGGANGAAEKMLRALEPRQQQAAQMVGIAMRGNQGQGTRQQGRRENNNQSMEVQPAMPMARRPAQQVVATNGDAPAQQQPRKMVLASGSGGTPLAGRTGQSEPTLAGDPGEKSESESDAFSHQGSAVFEVGQVEARFGRKVRTVRPNFTLSGQMDLMNMFEPAVQVEVHTDAQGKPTEVEVIQSSGSNNIDEPVRLALYDWWFEPPKDSHGHAMPDVMVWTIEFK